MKTGPASGARSSSSGNPADLTMIVDDMCDADDIAFIEEHVMDATVAAGEVGEEHELLIVVRDASGNLRAGVTGGTWGRCCELRYLWVDPDLRGRGLGSAVMAEAELEARRRGCHTMVLLTHDIQAPGFYESLGYQTAGVIENYPHGSSARWFQKHLGSQRLG